MESEQIAFANCDYRNLIQMGSFWLSNERVQKSNKVRGNPERLFLGRYDGVDGAVTPSNSAGRAVRIHDMIELYNEITFD